MPEYNVTVTVEKVTRTVTVEADDVEDAEATALDQLVIGVVAVDREPHVSKVEMTPESVEELYAEILGRLKETYELVYVDYDDEFSTKQVGWIVDGNFEKLWESNDEWESDSQYRGAEYVLNDVTTEDERDALGDRVSDLTEAIRERDCSDWPKQLARNTSDVMVRYRIGDATWTWGDDETEVIGEIAGTLGINPPTEGQTNALGNAIANAGDGGGLYLYFGMSVQDLLDVPQDVPLTITVENPYVLILDTMNGSGYVTDDAMPLTWTGDFDRDNLFLDKQGAGHGYSWDETCGGGQTPRYYKEPKVTITKKEVQDNA